MASKATYIAVTAVGIAVAAAVAFWSMRAPAKAVDERPAAGKSVV